MASSDITGVKIEVTILEGRDLVGKDSSLFSKKKTSDPFAKIFWGGEERGKTNVVEKTTNPGWNATFKIGLASNNMEKMLKEDPKFKALEIVVFDHDKMSKDECLGSVKIPLSFSDKPTNLDFAWYKLEKGAEPHFAKDAQGELQVKVSVTIDGGKGSPVKQEDKPIVPAAVPSAVEVTKKVSETVTEKVTEKVVSGGISTSETTEKVIEKIVSEPIKISETVTETVTEKVVSSDSSNSFQSIQSTVLTTVKLDIKISKARNLVAKDSSWFSKKKSSDPYAIIYWGKEQMGRTKTIKQNLNPEWNESFKVRASSKQMQQLVRRNPDYCKWDIVVFDNDPMDKDDPLGTFTIPMDFANKDCSTSWQKLGVGKEYPAKDASGEIEISYKVTVDYGNTKSMQINEAMPISTQFNGKSLTMELGWSKRSGPKIDEKLKIIEPHASAICFDDAFNLVDIASFKDSATRDKSLKHSGKLDKELGESISIALDKVNPSTHYICFVINSFNGRNLDKGLEGYSFKLHEPAGKIPIAESKFSKSESGEKFTALLMCCLYRDPASKGWMLRSLVLATPGIITNQVVDVLQDVIHQTMCASQQKDIAPPTKHTSGPRAELVIEC